MLEIFAIAFALSLDAFAVAVAAGMRLCGANARQSFRLSFHFGLFQGLMPILGWLAGTYIHHYIAAWDHWVACILLCAVGINMIREAFGTEETQNECLDPTRGLTLIMLSLATSIDALAVGISMAMVGESIWLAASIIAIVCAIITLLGLHLGSFASSKINGLRSKACVLGGITLIGIGLNILYTNGVFTFS